jgi:AraC-like DNA-binding protein
MILYEAERSDKKQYIYSQEDKSLNFQKHTHHSFEVIFVLQGQLICNVNNNIFTLNSNEGMLILPGQIHSYTTIEYSKSYLCVFSNDIVELFYDTVKEKELTNPVFTFEDTRDIDVLRDKRVCIFLKQSILLKLCGTVFEQSELISIEKSEFMLTNTLAFYVQDNYTKNISLKQISKELGYNYTYLSSFFNQNFNMCFSEYVNRFRVQYATYLLASTDKDITEISLLCGFSTIRNFNIAFKKEYKKTPRDYRASL